MARRPVVMETAQKPKMAPPKRKAPPPPKREQPGGGKFKDLAAAGKAFKGWLPARESLTEVRAVPTIFPQVDRVLRVGGWPIERFSLIHGPSSHGKTIFLAGLGLSFVKRANYFGLVDAEYTSPISWLSDLYGEHVDSERFYALRPKTYEETILATRSFAQGIVDLRESGKISQDITGLVGVDSIRKLVPENLMEKILKGDSGVDGARGRGAQIKAAMNSSWMDELTPLLYHSGIAMAVIARETEDPDSIGKFKQVKVGGGAALYYDASVVARISRAGWVKAGSGDDAPVIGERHRVEIRKTKVAGKDDKVVVGYFHTSNGVQAPPGYDRPRDVFELGVHYGLVEEPTKAHFAFQGEKLGHGENAAVKRLWENEELFADLERLVREQFSPDEKIEGHNDDGEVT